jgi:hypothetical protein
MVKGKKVLRVPVRHGNQLFEFYDQIQTAFCQNSAKCANGYTCDECLFGDENTEEFKTWYKKNFEK